MRGPVNVADARPAVTRDLVHALFAAANRPIRIVPMPGLPAAAVATGAATAWRALRRPAAPPITRCAVSRLRGPFVLDLGRLHHELGIRPDRDPVQAIRAGELDLTPRRRDRRL